MITIETDDDSVSREDVGRLLMAHVNHLLERDAIPASLYLHDDNGGVRATLSVRMELDGEEAPQTVEPKTGGMRRLS